jgi:small-conductance mechanosensitive channel
MGITIGCSQSPIEPALVEPHVGNRMNERLERIYGRAARLVSGSLLILVGLYFIAWMVLQTVTGVHMPDKPSHFEWFLFFIIQPFIAVLLMYGGYRLLKRR